MRSHPCGPAMRTPLASPRRSPFHGRTDHALPSHGVMGRVLNDWTSFSPALSSSIGVLDIDMQGTVRHLSETGEAAWVDSAVHVFRTGSLLYR